MIGAFLGGTRRSLEAAPPHVPHHERDNSHQEELADQRLADILVLAGSTLMAEFLSTFADFPPRQKAASFTIDQALAKLEAGLTSGR